MSKLITSPLTVRPAVPGDAEAISAVHCSNVETWREWTAAGPRPARYADLSACQRWQNGGPWLDAQTCRWHLERLLAGGGLAWVAELRGRVLAAAELHPAEEPAPYGRHLNLSTLYVHRNHQGQGLGSALLKQAVSLVGELDCDSLQVAHAEAPDFYRRHGLKAGRRWAQWRMPIRAAAPVAGWTRRPLADGPYDAHVAGWALVAGRQQNARHDWERTRPGAVPDFPEWRGLRLERWSLSGSKGRAAVVLEESPAERGLAEVFIFSPDPALDLDLLAHVRGLAARAGFGALQILIPAGLRLPSAIRTGYSQQVYQIELGEGV